MINERNECKKDGEKFAIVSDVHLFEICDFSHELINRLSSISAQGQTTGCHHTGMKSAGITDNLKDSFNLVFYTTLYVDNLKIVRWEHKILASKVLF